MLSNFQTNNPFLKMFIYSTWLTETNCYRIKILFARKLWLNFRGQTHYSCRILYISNIGNFIEHIFGPTLKLYYCLNPQVKVHYVEHLTVRVKVVVRSHCCRGSSRGSLFTYIFASCSHVPAAFPYLFHITHRLSHTPLSLVPIPLSSALPPIPLPSVSPHLNSFTSW